MIETIKVGELSVLHAGPRESTRRPVLFIHGYFVDASVWTRWLEFFSARGIPAFAVHLRGRAGSRLSINLGRVSIDDFVEDASAVARHIGTPAVVGHSMGALVAQKLGERGEVSAAVLLTPAPPRGISVLSPRVAMLQLKYMPAILSSRVVRPGREDLRELTLNRVPPNEQEALLAAMIPDSGRAGRDMSVTGYPVDRARVRCPMLVVAAEDDRFIPQRVVARVAKRYGAPLDVMRGRGHMLIVEPGWEQLADRVERWIGEHA